MGRWFLFNNANDDFLVFANATETMQNNVFFRIVNKPQYVYSKMTREISVIKLLAHAVQNCSMAGKGMTQVISNLF